jgi:hypothetical protein
MSTLAKLISNYYIISTNDMSIESYNKIVKLYNKIKVSPIKYVDVEEWNNIYTYKKNMIPEVPPTKEIILNTLYNKLKINYNDLIYDFYSLLDNIQDVKKLTDNIINKFNFIIFIFTKQPNITFKINTTIWNQLRSRCLIGKTKTKMPRESISLQEVILQINNVLFINS